MRWVLSTVGPTATGLAISIVLVVVSQSALVRTSWLQPALTLEYTSFDRVMQALQRKLLIDSFVVHPAAAIVAGGVVGLLSRRRARVAALIAALPMSVLGMGGAFGWVEIVQIAAYGGLAWTAATFAHRWRHPEPDQG